MKVRVAYTEEVSDDFRHGIKLYYGQTGIATREEVKNFFWAYGMSMNDDIGVLADNEYNANLSEEDE